MRAVITVDDKATLLGYHEHALNSIKQIKNPPF